MMHDYRINWALSAKQIPRFVDAVGWPYMGAKSVLQGREIRIDRVEPCRDLAFAIDALERFGRLPVAYPKSFAVRDVADCGSTRKGWQPSQIHVAPGSTYVISSNCTNQS